MTDKEKLEKIKQLADTMYNKMQNLTTDTLGIRKAMDDYHQFIIYQYYKEEPVSGDLGDYINELSKQFPEVSFAKLSRIAVRVAKWQKEQIMAKAIDGIARPDDGEVWCDLKSFNFKDGDKVKVIVIKED